MRRGRDWGARGVNDIVDDRIYVGGRGGGRLIADAINVHAVSPKWWMTAMDPPHFISWCVPDAIDVRAVSSTWWVAEFNGGEGGGRLIADAIDVHAVSPKWWTPAVDPPATRCHRKAHQHKYWTAKNQTKRTYQNISRRWLQRGSRGGGRKDLRCVLMLVMKMVAVGCGELAVHKILRK